jgi:hypothetical protein
MVRLAIGTLSRRYHRDGHRPSGDGESRAVTGVIPG